MNAAASRRGRPLRFLVADSEPPEARDQRRSNVGCSSGETYIETLKALAPDAVFWQIKPADSDAVLPDRATLADYDGVFLTGSPLHLYEPTPEVRRQIEFMRALFASGTPSFGSCAGLQVATVAAGGSVQPNSSGIEAGFARKVTKTREGAEHPLLAGRPMAFDAPAIHTDEVKELPEGATLLASNAITSVQAAEIRSGEGVFWGVQYHPEISLYEVAGALRRDADSLVKNGTVRDRADLDLQIERIEALDREPDRQDLRWLLALDDQVANRDLRQAEIRNFIEKLVRPKRTERGRG
ncbi:GMP synthase (glutamine-hydrolysing) [Faunimonas pinastri]|uniref:GMP synthase (Glutamine-hydrolysing) n=1 Tax=Faunimonas pinastri TaxID=1855383 RepID=A0A1H9KTK4_9HYPH|nr:type 1 glutamine amidotransferase [Faunimonas pinastri]SER02247.1 GMP synthase (glutamine-hydrolysing) [Faunimonas pinastri]